MATLDRADLADRRRMPEVLTGGGEHLLRDLVGCGLKPAALRAAALLCCELDRRHVHGEPREPTPDALLESRQAVAANRGHSISGARSAGVVGVG